MTLLGVSYIDTGKYSSAVMGKTLRTTHTGKRICQTLHLAIYCNGHQVESYEHFPSFEHE